MFSFEDKEKERLIRPFRRSLVVKLMGRQPSYGFMTRKLRQIWARKGNIDILDLENDFYLVSFQIHEDYMEALTGGPWVITDAYLSVTRWKPEFNPKCERIDSVVAWVRFPDLPAPLFDKKFLLNLGNSIGRAIRLDIHTAQRARGKFARMCVELDLTKPLVPEFNVEGQVLSVVYESLGMLCKKCGRVGHNKEGCETFNKKPTEGSGAGGIHNNSDKRRGLGESNKGAGRGRGRGLGRTDLEGRVDKEERRVNVLSEIKQGDSMRVSKGSQSTVRSKVVVPVSNLERFEGRSINMNGKENMHPGEFNGKGGGKEGRIQPGVANPVGDEDPIGSLDTRMEEECVALANTGAASKGVASVIRDMRFRYKLSLMIILEPRISGVQASKVIKQWGFKHSIRKEAAGFSGGIWLLWEMDEIKVEVLRLEEQFIHCNLKLGENEFLFSAIYASPNENRRRSLWEWQEKFVNAAVKVVPRVSSDHHPLVVNLNGTEGGRRGRQFRYEAVWHMHDDFEMVMRNGWKGEDEAHMKLAGLKQSLIRWNKEVFGRIEGRKRRLLSRLNGIQKTIKAELMAVLTGLEIAANFCFDSITVECDSVS
ncbi:hypothetical protein K1719_024407 [Acacia pycnantha]|nr:hypothetical protein K1719_024407 [Acacia pycnantha]